MQRLWGGKEVLPLPRAKTSRMRLRRASQLKTYNSSRLANLRCKERQFP